MKTLTTFVFLLFSIVSLAQINGINYKALIKSTNGNVVNNTSTTIEFTIYKGTGLFNTYRETHTIFTDSNGILIANIGEGTIVNGVFNNVNWSDDEYFLGVKIDTGAGYVDLGITAFKTVPYAIQATKATIAETALNANGLERINEGNGFGWRLKGRNMLHYGNIGKNAIDFSYNFSSSDTHGATGEYAFASGYQTIASGFVASAFGNNTIASENYSTTFGSHTEASNNNATAFGDNTIASGLHSTAFGYYTAASGTTATTFGRGTAASGSQATSFGSYTSAPSYSEFAVGTYNTTYTPINPYNFDAADRLFVVGNGEADNARSDALTILKNGTITAPSFDISEIIDNKAIITKEYADVNYNNISSGLEALDESNGVGYRIKNRVSGRYGNIGKDATDLSYSSSGSTTRGATGDYSFAIGKNIHASGDYSMASGELSQAIGLNSVALGSGSTSQGDYSIALGKDARAWAYGSLAIGRYSKGNGSSTLWFDNDPIFEIGNGTSPGNTKNGLTVFKNGKMVIGDESEENIAINGNEITALNNTVSSNLILQKNDGKLAIGNVIPDAKLHIFGGNDASMANGTGYVVIGDLTGQNMVIDQNEIIARFNGANTNLILQYEGGNVIIGSANNNANLLVSGSIQYTGTITDTSDKRLKENFASIDNVLERLQKIEGLSYNMKDDKNKKREYGVIAQDVQKVFPEMVSVIDTENQYLGVSYIQLIPVLLEGIKEQQAIIDKQNNDYAALLKRVEALESKNTKQRTIVLNAKSNK